HVDALQPPEPAVAPVAPLEGHAELPERLALVLGQEVVALVLIGEEGGDAGAQPRGIEALAFGLLGQPGVELADDRLIAGPGRASDKRHGCPLWAVVVSSVDGEPASRGTEAVSYSEALEWTCPATFATFLIFRNPAFSSRT